MRRFTLLISAALWLCNPALGNELQKSDAEILSDVLYGASHIVGAPPFELFKDWVFTPVALSDLSAVKCTLQQSSMRVVATSRIEKATLPIFMTTSIALEAVRRDGVEVVLSAKSTDLPAFIRFRSDRDSGRRTELLPTRLKEAIEEYSASIANGLNLESPFAAGQIERAVKQAVRGVARRGTPKLTRFVVSRSTASEEEVDEASLWFKPERVDDAYTAITTYAERHCSSERRTAR